MSQRDGFAPATATILQRATQMATEFGHGFVGSEHILLSISAETGNQAVKALLNAGLDEEIIRELIEEYDSDAKESKNMMMPMSSEAEQILSLAENKAKEMHHKHVEPEHLLLAILLEKESAAAKLIQSTGVDLDDLLMFLMKSYDKNWSNSAMESQEQKQKRIQTKTLDKYSKDLTDVAKKGGFDPFIGREKEIQRIIQILSRRTKNNPVLIGEPGVGKTAIAEGLAQQIADERVPKNLLGKRILSMDLKKLLAGTKFRGDFEERIEAYLDEAQKAKDVILFIDELHTLIGSGAAEGAMDAANAFKPALGRNEIQVIGSTTLNEYRKHIEKDAALERRFQPVMVDEPADSETLRILNGLKERYEKFHELTITDEAIQAAVDLSIRYIQDRYLPDKAIDLIDEAASRVRVDILTVPSHLKQLEDELKSISDEKKMAVNVQNFEQAAKLRDVEIELKKELEEKQKDWSKDQNNVVTMDDIASVVSAWTGIPVTMLSKDESQRLLNLEETLHKRIVGQDDAVSAVAKAIRRSRTGIKEPNHPIGSFLFLGPTGVGKTELCRTLADVMFQDEKAIIRMDMSEYMERHTVSKLIGSPPGYVGYDEGGQLTEKVRRKPYSIILFDEIEKAHPDVWNILLQIMDEGRLTDAQGRVVNFKNTIVVMTSNIGAQEITGKVQLGFSSAKVDSEVRPVDEIRERVMGELKKTFQPEFLNRLDDIIVFHQLDRKHIHTIANRMLKQLITRSSKLGIELLIDESAIDVLAAKGFDPVYGARPLRRTIQSMLEDAIAEKMLEGNIAEACTMTVTGKDEEISVSVNNKQ